LILTVVSIFFVLFVGFDSCQKWMKEIYIRVIFPYPISLEKTYDNAKRISISSRDVI
jgi:hypothetical protein